MNQPPERTTRPVADVGISSWTRKGASNLALDLQEGQAISTSFGMPEIETGKYGFATAMDFGV